jgi:hypothetical protein
MPRCRHRSSLMKFAEGGRLRLFYLHPMSPMAKMNSGKMRTVIEVYPPETVKRHYVRCCWVPIPRADAAITRTLRRCGRVVRSESLAVFDQRHP